MHLLGRELSEIATEDGILTSAFKSRVPVFCPAIADSAFGVSIGISRVEKKNPFQFDVIQDVVDMAQIVSKSRSTGVILFRRWHSENIYSAKRSRRWMLNSSARGHKYAIQVTTETEHYGSYSGAEFDQATMFGQLAKISASRHCSLRCHDCDADAGDFTFANRSESAAHPQADSIQLQQQRFRHQHAVEKWGDFVTRYNVGMTARCGAISLIASGANLNDAIKEIAPHLFCLIPIHFVKTISAKSFTF